MPDVSLCCSLRHICLRRTFLSCCGDFHLSVLAALTLFYWVLLERVGVSCLDCQQGLGAQLSALSPGWGLYLVKQHHSVTCVWHRLKSLFDRLQCFIVLWMFEFFPFFKPACIQSLHVCSLRKNEKTPLKTDIWCIFFFTLLVSWWTYKKNVIKFISQTQEFLHTCSPSLAWLDVGSLSLES